MDVNTSSRRSGPWIRGAVALGAAFALTACEAAAQPASRFNPFASFESRCAAIEPARIEVVALPLSYTEDYSVSFRALSRMNENMGARHRTVGLTQARLAYESTLETKGLEDRRGGRICARPSIRVMFTATPMTIYVAREFADDSCRRTAILAHEMKHVAVYRQYLAEIVAMAKRDLPALYGDQLVYAADAKASQEALRARLRDFMQEFMQARYAEVKARQAQVDTPDEYASLERACGSLPPS
jgi:hypothetical protein